MNRMFGRPGSAAAAGSVPQPRSRRASVGRTGVALVRGVVAGCALCSVEILLRVGDLPPLPLLGGGEGWGEGVSLSPSSPPHPARGLADLSPSEGGEVKDTARRRGFRPSVRT